MNFNFTEAQAKTPVTYGDFAIFLNEIFKMISEVKEDEHKSIELIVQSITDVLTKRMNEIEYNQIRDRKFFIRNLCSDGYFTVTELTSYYNNWCAEFDKLNKGVLDDVSKTNC